MRAFCLWSEQRACARCAGESNAGAMCAKLGTPRGGAQPELRDGEARGAGDFPTNFLKSP